jgi:AbiV family abortive infection protein
MASAEFLLEGAFYALEQCGRLLGDAAHLYNAGSFASAVVLAAFAREELGRERILLSLRAKILAGGTVTVDEIKAACLDHAGKQKVGMLSIQITTDDGDTRLAQVLRTRMTTSPQSPEYQAAEAELNTITKALQRRAPNDRHSQRAAALYVEPLSENRWNRPADTSQLLAHQFIQSAQNDYMPERDRRIGMKTGDPANDEIFDAIAKLPSRPDLPQPVPLPLPDD